LKVAGTFETVLKITTITRVPSGWHLSRGPLLLTLYKVRKRIPSYTLPKWLAPFYGCTFLRFASVWVRLAKPDSPKSSTRLHLPCQTPSPVCYLFGMKHLASGQFHIVVRTAEPPQLLDGGVAIGRTRFEKRFEGNLVAQSSVDMMSAGTAVNGSAGYVALERVEGELDGRAGSFILQHSGIMDRGIPELSVTVVPDSATGALLGLRGRMTIDIVDGTHRYTSDYEFREHA
jgi:Protein of unknown function (DUF3224)